MQSPVRPIAALFVRPDSIYHSLPGIDAYDMHRDARTWPGGCPVIAHPPCRSWGKLAHLSKAPPEEKDLALWAVRMVRQWGGILEHPASSKLWPAASLPAPGTFDRYNGWTFCVDQSWWGHLAPKRTLLYIVGCAPSLIPPYSPPFTPAPRRVNPSRTGPTSHLLHISKQDREHTPPMFASWLVALARRCHTPSSPLPYSHTP